MCSSIHRGAAWLAAILLPALAAAPGQAGSADGPRVVYPAGPNQLVRSAEHVLVLDPGTSAWAHLELTRVVQRRISHAVDMTTHRKDLARLVKQLFDDSFLINRIDIDLAAGGAGVKPVSLSETIGTERGLSLQEFWASQAFSRIYTAAVQDSLASRVTVTLTGRESTRIGRRSVETAECAATLLRLRLDQGDNELVLRSLDANGAVLSESAMSYRYQPIGDPDSLAAGLHVVSRFHRLPWEQCAPCHGSAPTPAELANPAGATRSCMPCHQRFLEHRVVHPPVGEQRCLTCHTAPLAESGTADQVACTGCHADLRKTLTMEARVHVTSREGRCTVCHDPHGSDHVAGLREDVHSLCTSCHQRRYEDGHPVLMHPVQGVKDPKNPGQALSCVSCHDPHASGEQSLVRVVEGQARRCNVCHPK